MSIRCCRSTLVKYYDNSSVHLGERYHSTFRILFVCTDVSVYVYYRAVSAPCQSGAVAAPWSSTMTILRCILVSAITALSASYLFAPMYLYTYTIGLSQLHVNQVLSQHPQATFLQLSKPLAACRNEKWIIGDVSDAPSTPFKCVCKLERYNLIGHEWKSERDTKAARFFFDQSAGIFP